MRHPTSDREQKSLRQEQILHSDLRHTVEPDCIPQRWYILVWQGRKIQVAAAAKTQQMMERRFERVAFTSYLDYAQQRGVLTSARNKIARRVQHREHWTANNPFTHQVRCFCGYDVSLQHRELILVRIDGSRCYGVGIGNRLNADDVWLRKRNLPLSRFLESLGYRRFNCPCGLVGVGQHCELPLQVREELLVEVRVAGLCRRTQRLRAWRFNSAASTITSSSSATGLASGVWLGWLASDVPYSVARWRSNSTADRDDG